MVSHRLMSNMETAKKPESFTVRSTDLPSAGRYWLPWPLRFAIACLSASVFAPVGGARPSSSRRFRCDRARC